MLCGDCTIYLYSATPSCLYKGNSCRVFRNPPSFSNPENISDFRATHAGIEIWVESVRLPADSQLEVVFSHLSDRASESAIDNDGPEMGGAETYVGRTGMRPLAVSPFVNIRRKLVMVLFTMAVVVGIKLFLFPFSREHVGMHSSHRLPSLTWRSTTTPLATRQSLHSATATCRTLPFNRPIMSHTVGPTSWTPSKATRIVDPATSHLWSCTRPSPLSAATASPC